MENFKLEFDLYRKYFSFIWTSNMDEETIKHAGSFYKWLSVQMNWTEVKVAVHKIKMGWESEKKLKINYEKKRKV